MPTVQRGGGAVLIHVAVAVVSIAVLYLLRSRIDATTDSLVAMNEYLEGAVFLRNFSILGEHYFSR